MLCGSPSFWGGGRLLAFLRAAFGFLGGGFWLFRAFFSRFLEFFLFRLNFSIFDAPVFVSTLAEMVNPCSFRLNINLKNICGEEIFLA